MKLEVLIKSKNKTLSKRVTNEQELTYYINYFLDDKDVTEIVIKKAEE